MDDKPIIEIYNRDKEEWEPFPVGDDAELRRIREELDELTASMMMAGDRIDRTRCTSIVAMIVGIASMLFLAAVLSARLAGWL